MLLNGGRVSDLLSVFHSRLETKALRIGVIGLGYVGLPLALTFVEAGFRVTGFDIDPDKIAALAGGESYIHHIQAARVARAVADKLLFATSDYDLLADQDAILICVPTPLTQQRDPDMRFVQSTSNEIAARLRAGQLVVLESTTYPGTTDELVRHTLDRGGLELGKDYLLAFSPEREDPGNRNFSTKTIPKLVGGVDELSGLCAEKLYAAALTSVVRVADARTAEAAKLTENIFRGVNIALVNELKIAFDKMGIDIWKVLDAAETKPFGFMRFNPGPGWGGHCIPIDPFYMAWKAREYEVTTKFIELAGEINVRMPEYVIGKLQNALNERGKALRGAKVLVLGVAYKSDVDDCRESPAFPIIEKLDELGAHVKFHDPYVTHLPRTRAWPHLERRTSTLLTPVVLREADAVLIVTAHSGLDYTEIAKHADLVVDTRGVVAKSPSVIRA